MILSWNRKAEIQQCLDAVRQVFAGEIVVVDQGSTDGSREILEARTDVELVPLETNVGVAEGRNLGNRAAKGDVVVSLDSDARFAPGFRFDDLARAFAVDPQLGAVAFRITDTEGRVLQWAHPNPPTDDRVPFETTRFTGAGHALRRQSFLDVGGYDPTLFFYWEEFDLSAKLIAAGSKVRYLPEYVVEHSLSPVQRLHWKTGRFYYRVRNRIYLTRKYFRRWPKWREVVFIAVAYAALGAKERLLTEAFRGIRDGLKMDLDPSELAGLDLDRYYEVWKHVERRNRPTPVSWLRKTGSLIREGS